MEAFGESSHVTAWRAPCREKRGSSLPCGRGPAQNTTRSSAP
eukprot:CAMPEP_0182915470 /NCGR_PEP_ID=MMETSP0105_2-20130417/347_1 /TAXON_ID=81532 ORGANISM="Acanthoeca-like sp., Strain 10tr" /NCGR_SAMPLE_ID=MMETSP0105_2 /ASSEMBLY_ACC=CAM_ASM_000205 /LENGTH=41 /DNA_ID= /DNA_START= /DNA_END= /DNA_ORIENTATION=